MLCRNYHTSPRNSSVSSDLGKFSYVGVSPGVEVIDIYIYVHCCCSRLYLPVTYLRVLYYNVAYIFNAMLSLNVIPFVILRNKESPILHSSSMFPYLSNNLCSGILSSFLNI